MSSPSPTPVQPPQTRTPKWVWWVIGALSTVLTLSLAFTALLFFTLGDQTIRADQLESQLSETSARVREAEEADSRRQAYLTAVVDPGTQAGLVYTGPDGEKRSVIFQDTITVVAQRGTEMSAYLGPHGTKTPQVLICGFSIEGVEVSSSIEKSPVGDGRNIVCHGRTLSQ